MTGRKNPNNPGDNNTTVVVLKIGKRTARKLLTKANNPPALEQLAEVAAWINEKGLSENFEMLPSSSDLTFWPVGECCMKTDSTLDMKLFCGEIHEHQTWAMVRKYPSKAPELFFVNEYRTGELKPVIESSEMAMMYPFKVFKKYGDLYALRQLRHILLYLFLANGHADKVFPNGFPGAKRYLSWGLSRISKAYETKGIENIPTMHPPGEDFSIVRGQQVLPTALKEVREYDDDLKTVNSGTSSDEEDTIIAGQSVSDIASSIVVMGPPQVPSYNEHMNDLESRLESISVADVAPTPGLSRQISNKRKMSAAADFATFKRLKREREALTRERRSFKEKSNKIKANMSIIEERDLKKRDEIEALLAGKSADEIKAWLMASDSISEEDEENEVMLE